MNKDYYEILGLNKNSSDEDIKLAYKKLAMKYHPDRNPNDPNSEEKFKEIKNAYEMLINKKYKIENNSFKDYNVSFGNFDDSNFTNFMNTEESLDDVFKIIFQNEFKQEQNIIAILEIDLEQSVYGSSVYLKTLYQISCKKCNGKGFKPGSNVKICNKCSGSGLYTIVQGLFTFRQKCFKCNGKGYLSLNTCVFCNGEGKLNNDLLGWIDIPAGSDDESLVLFDFSENNSDDFLDEESFILLKVKNHPIFIRKNIDNNDLYVKLIISFTKAILGGYVKIYTLYGYIIYQIKKGSQCNDTYIIREKGLNYNENYGDLYCEVLIEIPLNINIYQELLIKKIDISMVNFDLNYPLIFKWRTILNSFYCNLLEI